MAAPASVSGAYMNAKINAFPISSGSVPRKLIMTGYTHSAVTTAVARLMTARTVRPVFPQILSSVRKK